MGRELCGLDSTVTGKSNARCVFRVLHNGFSLSWEVIIMKDPPNSYSYLTSSFSRKSVEN